MAIHSFVHLRSRSYFSFNEGLPSPTQLVQTAVDEGMHAIALTDHYGLSGALEFYIAGNAIGCQPILGALLPVNHPLGRGELVFLARDISGWQSLCKLSSLLLCATHRDPSQGIDWYDVSQNTKGLICMSAGRSGLIWKLLDQHRTPDAHRYLNELTELFPHNLFVELQIHEPRDHIFTSELASIAKSNQLPIVATHDIYYIEPSASDIQHTLSAIRQNGIRDAIPKGSIAPPHSNFPSTTEMESRFKDYPEALEKTKLIADQCLIDLPLDQPHFPEIQYSSDKTAQEILRERTLKGAKERYGSITPEIEQRLDHELATILDRGYAPLFLIVEDILNFARHNAVPISSRGSAASSLVAYCLGITSPDPLALNLYFERFLNPARHSPPDIDIDLCSTRRDKVIQYVYTKYGADRVAMVATVNRYRYRSALREVGKAFGLSTSEIKDMIKHLPGRRWGPPSVRSRASGDDPFSDLRGKFRSQKYHTIFDHAASLLDHPRHLSIHPGGIVIAPQPIVNLVPTQLTSKGIVITQFDLDIIERIGLVKIDLLGIRGLSVLGDVSEKIYSWRRNEFPDSLSVLDAIPDDDPDTRELVRNARTIGCFQIESPGMRLTLREIDAQNPNDIMIALALYRPGPLTGGLKDAFVRRHLGQEKVEQLHPSLTSLLSDTYGVILYQEQVLRIASELAGLSLADADLLRRAMSHFDPGDRMKTLKERFIEGAFKQNKVPPDKGDMIWELMAAFAGYGFPKAHAASYAQIGWRSAWCKVHYPAEFIAAVLANWGGYYSQRIYLSEARRMGHIVQPPHINHAGKRFTVAYPDGEAVIYIGLDQVSSLTQKTQSRIIAERPFKSLGDLLTRVDPRPIEIKNLIQVGALRGFGAIPELLSKIESGGWRYRQPPLFDIDYETIVADEWDINKRVAAQQSILGASLDAHPIELLQQEIISKHSPISSSELHTNIGETVRILGIRQTLQRLGGQSGSQVYALELEDLDGLITILLPQELYNHQKIILRSHQPLVVEGSVAYESKLREPVLLAERVWSAYN